MILVLINIRGCEIYCKSNSIIPRRNIAIAVTYKSNTGVS